MGSAQRIRTLGEQRSRPLGVRPELRLAKILPVIFCACLVVLAAPGLRAQSYAANSVVGPGGNSGAVEDAASLKLDDVEIAIEQMEALGRFFAAIATRDANGFAQESWRRLGVSYVDTAGILRSLLERGDLVIGDLPAGRTSGLLDNGQIVLDRSLDGHWLPSLPQADANEAARERDILLSVLMQGLARRLPPQDWPWLADHLRGVGGFADLAQEPALRPLLARFFQAKDAYFWFAMKRIAAGDATERQAFARRQVSAFSAIRALRSEMSARFGAEPAERLQREWVAYVALVDGFAVTRGWLLLDPTLRLTHLGQAAREDADAIERAAAEVVASAPRSALAAAIARVGRGSVGLRPEDKLAPRGSVEPPANLGDIVAQARADAISDLAGRLPLAALAMRPELFANTTDPASFRAFAAEIKEAVRQPDARLALAEREAELGAVHEELLGMKARMAEMNEALRLRGDDAERLEKALATEREGRAAAERRLEEELAAWQGVASQVEKLVVEPEEVAQAPEQESTAAPSIGNLAFFFSRIDQRQLYIAAAVVALCLLVLLLWLRGRRRAVQMSQLQAPLFLQAPAEEQRMPSVAVPSRPVIEVEKTADPAEARADVPAGPPAEKPQPEPERQLRQKPPQAAQRVKVMGVKPATRTAAAAMRAGAAQAASLGSEAAAAAHPIVQALRKGNLPLFELLFSEMTDLHSPQLQRIVYGGRGEDLAIVCRAVGIDKLLFGSIYLLTDNLRGGDGNEDPARAAEILRLYDRTPPVTAQKVLKKWQRNWGDETQVEASSGD